MTVLFEKRALEKIKKEGLFKVFLSQPWSFLLMIRRNELVFNESFDKEDQELFHEKVKFVDISEEEADAVREFHVMHEKNLVYFESSLVFKALKEKCVLLTSDRCILGYAKKLGITTLFLEDLLAQLVNNDPSELIQRNNYEKLSKARIQELKKGARHVKHISMKRQ